MTLLLGLLMAGAPHRETAPRSASVEPAALSPAMSPEARPTTEIRGLDPAGALPLVFVENTGQLDRSVKYYAQHVGYGVYLRQDGLVLSFVESRPPTSFVAQADPRHVAGARAANRGTATGMRFVGANRGAVLEPGRGSTGRVSSFIGSDSSRWRTGLAAYREIVYRNLWPGVDLELRVRGAALEHTFIVHAGGRLEDVRVAWEGAAAPTPGSGGGLDLRTGRGVLRVVPAAVFRLTDGTRVPVRVAYRPVQGSGGREVSLAIEPMSGTEAPPIAPGFLYAGFLGGSTQDVPGGMAVDAEGNLYVCGTTGGANFPTTPGAFDVTSQGADVFVAKLDAAGGNLVYSTFLGGNDGADRCNGLAVDAGGSAYVTGSTASKDFPTTPGAYDRTFNGSVRGGDSFVAKLHPSGSRLVYSTALARQRSETTLGIDVDAAGNAYVVGQTTSPTYPTTVNAFDRTFNGDIDAFMTVLNPEGSDLVFSTFLTGASGFALARGVAVDAEGRAYVTGFTGFASFPTTPGAFDLTYGGGASDAFVMAFGTGFALTYSTFLGGTDADETHGIALDEGGSAYVVGTTRSIDFPTTAGAFDTHKNSADGFVTKLSPAGSALMYSTFLGGAGAEFAFDVIVDRAGRAAVAGGTSSLDFPVTPDALDASLGGPDDAYLALLSADGSSLDFSSLLGGAASEYGAGVALDDAGNAFVSGATTSDDFPTTIGAFDRLYNGGGDVFLVGLAIAPGGSWSATGAPQHSSARRATTR